MGCNYRTTAIDQDPQIPGLMREVILFMDKQAMVTLRGMAEQRFSSVCSHM